MDEGLAAVARRHGIATEYLDVWGRTRTASEATDGTGPVWRSAGWHGVPLHA